MNDDLSTHHSGRFIHFVTRGTWEFAERRGISGIVVIVARTPSDEILLVEQYRPPVDRSVIELPAGLAGDRPGEAGEALELAAQRELEEETGFRAESFEFLCEGPPAAGITSEIVTFFLAHQLTRVGEGGGDATENISVHRVPLAEADAWLTERQNSGTLIDPKVYSGLYFLNKSKLGGA